MTHPKVTEAQDHVAQAEEGDPAHARGEHDGQAEPVGPVEDTVAQVVEVGPEKGGGGISISCKKGQLDVSYDTKPTVVQSYPDRLTLVHFSINTHH